MVNNMKFTEFETLYPFTLEQDLVWGEMDAFQHLNNVAYFRLFESVRIAYFEKLGVLTTIKSRNIGPILHSTDCRFKLPLTYPDKLLLGASISSIESDRYRIDHGIYSYTHQKVAATGSGLIVCYDYNRQEKSKIPESLIQSIIDFQKDCEPKIISLEKCSK